MSTPLAKYKERWEDPIKRRLSQLRKGRNNLLLLKRKTLTQPVNRISGNEAFLHMRRYQGGAVGLSHFLQGTKMGAGWP